VIVEWLLQFGTGLGQWFLLLLPSFPADTLASGALVLADLGRMVASLGVWVDWFALAAQVTFVLGLYFTALSFRTLRAILGHVPIIGGNG
jgi:hypothetical protein